MEVTGNNELHLTATFSHRFEPCYLIVNSPQNVEKSHMSIIVDLASDFTGSI